MTKYNYDSLADLRSAIHRNVDINRFLRGGIDLNELHNGSTALNDATNKRCSLAAIRSLVEAGADVNFPDALGNTPIISFANRANRSEEDEDICRYLLDNGADINASNNHGTTALMIAAECYWKSNIMKVLLHRGANVNASDSEGITPLHFAALDKNADKILLLLEAGADRTAINAAGETPAAYAEEFGQTTSANLIEQFQPKENKANAPAPSGI